LRACWREAWKSLTRPCPIYADRFFLQIVIIYVNYRTVITEGSVYFPPSVSTGFLLGSDLLLYTSNLCKILDLNRSFPQRPSQPDFFTLWVSACPF
jgi:hypothetical protein